MATSGDNENLQDVLAKVEQDEAGIAEKGARHWLQPNLATNVMKSLTSLNSSDSSSKSSARSEDESTYWEIDKIAGGSDKSLSLLLPAELKKSPVMNRASANITKSFGPSADYAKAKKKSKHQISAGIDNAAFETDITDGARLLEHNVNPATETKMDRLASIPADYDDDGDDNVGSPAPDYGQSAKPSRDVDSFSFEQFRPQVGVKKFPGSVPVFSKKDETIPMRSMGGPRSPPVVHFNTNSAHEDHQPETSFVSSDPLTLSDLSKLPELNLDSITECIKRRYFHDKIYTYCGEILISVNPYKSLDICTYLHHSKYTYGQISDEPHLFAVSAKAYSAIRDLKHNQVILVSGESGAGKTEATKFMVQHLMSIGGSEYESLMDRIIKINPLLEAFGNAKTILNNNSSRFAKFLSLAVNEDGKIESARVKDYMLEKSRVVHHNLKERTFHAFYALLVGGPDDLLESLYINRKNNFRITGEYYSLSGKEKELYKTIYQEQQDVFHLIKLTSEEIQDVNSILAAILHLGNVQFEDSDNDSVIIKNESAVQQVANLLQLDFEKLARVLIERKGRLGKDRQVTFPAFFSNSDSGSSFLGTPSRGGIYQTQRDFLVTSSSRKSSDDDTEAGEIIELSKNKKQAEDERDAIAKVLYERMFGWLVRKINESLKANKFRNLPSIGILDICGFENLEANSFEQLCINIVNEQLQNFMNKKVIEEERQLYIDENVEISDIDISGINNDAILNMFMEKTGILAMIDEDSKLEFSDDDKLIIKLKTMFDKSPHFESSLNNTPEFVIVHFAGKVSYSGLSFIKKNRDTLSGDSIECLKASENSLIQDLFTVTESYTGSISMSQYNFRGSRKPTIKQRPIITESNLSQSINQSRKATLQQKFGANSPSLKTVDKAKRNTHITFFRNSLKELLNAMREADPYFVRCIKPNDKQKAKEFIEEQVKMQLQYNGVKEAARIRTFGFGFPIRMSKSDFELKFKDLVAYPTGAHLAYDIFEAIHADKGSYKMGKTQIFMKESLKKALENKLAELRWHQEQEKKKKMEEERLEREKQEKLEKERFLKEHREKERIRAMTQDTVDGLDSLETIVEVQTPASNISDSVYNMTQRINSSQDFSELNSTMTTNIDDEEDDTDSSETDPKTLEGSENKPTVKQNAPWDISQELTEEEEKKDVHEQPVLMVIKFIVYILLLGLLIGSLTFQKISLMITINNSNSPSTCHPRDTCIESRSKLYLVIAMCIPIALWWIITVLKLCFGNFKVPSLWTWIWVFIMECLHTVGMCLLVFRVLPNQDPIRGLMLLSGTALIPSILKFTMSDVEFHTSYGTFLECKQGSFARKAFRILFDVISMILQFSVIPLCIGLNFKVFPESSQNFSKDTWKIVELIFALVLVSCGHWENFADGRFFCELKKDNWFKNAVLKMRFELQKGRHYPHLIALLLKIGITFWLAYQLGQIDYLDTFKHISQKSKIDMKDISAVITLCISSFVAFYLAFGACMFQMQIPSLTLPLTFSTPAAILVIGLDSQYNFLQHLMNIDENGNNKSFHSFDWERWYHVVFGIIWWISLLLLSRHIWRPQKDRTANMERLFINPSYCGILTTENIMLNRKRNPHKVVEIINFNEEGDIESKFYKIRNSNKKNDPDDVGSDIDEDFSDETMESATSKASGDEATKNNISPTVPMLYACATMWHETRTEMVQLLKSLHRLDRDQYIRRLANESVKGYDPDFYNFEAHIFFDDAMELDDNDQRVPNRWVKDLVSCMDVACSSVHGKPMKVHPPIKVPTPYGGQLIWQMPGENLLFVHMKDVSKIRNRKRWSQVMYMYYLLGYRHIMTCKNDLLEKMRKIDAGRGGFGLSIHEINYLLGESAAARSQNTFLLALDGDTDFSPGSVKILLDRMKDENVGAACGRIHPIGNGPMIWYQKFEYAIGHWLQKAAEHVFGCVLCSPGCFSLFRAAALMDTNVMKKYTTEPTEPGHHLQFDQGEDRWLCTLMLQQGYRIEYAAAADAWTFAPEGFFEFFNQRRRWMPSTIANILDLLSTATLTTKKNPSMSRLYIGYQWLLMLMTILGPATILMMIAGAAKLVFTMTNVDAYLFATIPAVVFTISCFWLRSQFQLIFAAVLSIVYTFIMMIVFVGTIITASTNNIFHPSVIVIVILSGIFIIAGFCHPQEIWCLVHGILYLLTIPSGYLLLVIYSICNLNDVSWGTREVPTKAQRLEMEQKKKEKEEQKKNKQRKGFLARIFNRGEEHLKELTNLVKTLIPEKTNQPHSGLEMNDETGKSVVELLCKIENNLKILIDKNEHQDVHQTLVKRIDDDTHEQLTSVVVDQPTTIKTQTPVLAASIKRPEVEKPKEEKTGLQPLHSILKKGPVKKRERKVKKPVVRDELRNPFWSEDKGLGDGDIIIANEKELQFWKEFVTKYLLPIRPTPEEKKKIADGLRELRNSSSFALIIVNLLWMALNFMFQEKQVARVSFNYNFNGQQKFEESILGFAFVALLLLLLFLQMIGMLIHRMGTLQHLLAITEIKLRKGDTAGAAKDKQEREDVMRHIKEVLKIPAVYDEGNQTQPPQLAEQDNPLGLSVIGASTRGSLGTSRIQEQQMLSDQLSKSVKTMGHIFDAQRMSVKNYPNRDALERLQSVKRRLISGAVHKKLEDFEPGLGRSFRPNLPPRSKRSTPALMQTTNNWGFTMDELSRAPFIENNIGSGSVPNHFAQMGAMGRTLMQRSKIINEVASENPILSNRSPGRIRWSNSDVGQTRKPSYKTNQRNHHDNSVVRL